MNFFNILKSDENVASTDEKVVSTDEKVAVTEVIKPRFVRASDVVASPNLFQKETEVEMEFADSKVRFIANDLDAYLYARSRLTDAQLAALSAQLEQRSSVFDSLTDDQRIQFLSSRYNQNFASVDNYRNYLLQHMDDFEQEIKTSLAEQAAKSETSQSVAEPPKTE